MELGNNSNIFCKGIELSEKYKLLPGYGLDKWIAILTRNS